MAPFYVTTPIYYVNDVPHLGHAYTTIVADTLARYHRARGDETWFLTGTDEHGEKIEAAARNAGLSPLAHADRVVERFRAMWQALGITNDDFIRTTEERHKVVVQALWQRLVDQGDIYLGEYEGRYCVACETFYTELQLEEGRLCPTHKQEAVRVKEKSYCFRMSKYEKPLLEFLEGHPEFIRPEGRYNEVMSFVRGGLRDLSVSRSTFKWGIGVPGDPAHVIYVWVDALANYISALGGWESAAFKQYWPHAVHLVGKDIIRFHCVYWPAILLAAGLPLPRAVVAHGWWTVRGQKISKSIPVTRVDPAQITRELGNDALRYYLLREIPLGADGDMAYESLIKHWNSALANDYGNLVSRTIGMAKGELVAGGDDAALAALAVDVRERAERHMEAFEPSRALEAIWELVRAANNTIAQKEPYRLPAPERAGILAAVAEAIRWVTLLVAPVLPETATRVFAQLGLPPGEQWPTRFAYPGSHPTQAAALFPKIDTQREAQLLNGWLAPAQVTAPTVPAFAATPRGAASQPQAAAAAGGGATSVQNASLGLADFAKVDLRVAVIVDARRHPKADKLLHLDVDVGEGRLRSIVAGIATAYAPEQLIGRRVIVVANLAPATIRGVLSEGMLLAASVGDGPGLLTLDGAAAAGTKVS